MNAVATAVNLGQVSSGLQMVYMDTLLSNSKILKYEYKVTITEGLEEL